MPGDFVAVLEATTEDDIDVTIVVNIRWKDWVMGSPYPRDDALFRSEIPCAVGVFVPADCPATVPCCEDIQVAVSVNVPTCTERIKSSSVVITFSDSKLPLPSMFS